MKLPNFSTTSVSAATSARQTFFKLNKAVTYDEFDMIDIPEDESDSDDAEYFDESEDDTDDDFTDAIEF